MGLWAAGSNITTSHVQTIAGACEKGASDLGSHLTCIGVQGAADSNINTSHVQTTSGACEKVASEVIKNSWAMKV